MLDINDTLHYDKYTMKACRLSMCEMKIDLGICFGGGGYFAVFGRMNKGTISPKVFLVMQDSIQFYAVSITSCRWTRRV